MCRQVFSSLFFKNFCFLYKCFLKFPLPFFKSHLVTLQKSVNSVLLGNLRIAILAHAVTERALCGADYWWHGKI